MRQRLSIHRRRRSSKQQIPRDNNSDSDDIQDQAGHGGSFGLIVLFGRGDADGAQNNTQNRRNECKLTNAGDKTQNNSDDTDDKWCYTHCFLLSWKVKNKWKNEKKVKLLYFII